jgi:Cu2+-exporting ATPase/Cu+-exporting ATPase
MALIIGGIMGVFNLVRGVPENYFDSLTTLVFLLLLSRFFLQKVQEMSLTSQDLHFFYLNENVLRAVDGNGESFEEVHPSLLKRDDLIKIRANEFVPADGLVIGGESHMNNSLLTGESFPVAVQVGQHVFSGTQNLGEDLLVRVEMVQKQTRLGKILKSVEDGWFQRSKIVTLTNRVSKYFTIVVCLLSLGLFFYLWQFDNLAVAFERSITLLIVTCPCALALAVPLTFTRALSLASRHGIIIKSDEVIENLSLDENIFLDKTGTITHGKLELSEFKLLKQPAFPISDIIYLLEQRSTHPVATVLKEFAHNNLTPGLSVSKFKETFGVGVSGMISNHYYEIKREGIFEDHTLIATFSICDTIRDDSKLVLSRIMSGVKSVQVLSGDKNETVQEIANAVNLPLDMAHGNLKPEEKSILVRNSTHSMMVGDGANDAIALSHATVGVAVYGAVDISLRAADVYLSTPGLAPLEKLLDLSRETMKVVRRNLVLSLLYNSVSVAAVFMGLISPLVAAVIMPLSSLTVLGSTILGTKKSRAIWKS